MKIGLMIMSVIDIIYNLAFAIGMGCAWGHFMPSLPYIALLIMEVLLFFGSCFEKPGLIIPFLVMMMINIVASFIMWIVLPVLYFAVIASESSYRNGILKNWSIKSMAISHSFFSARRNTFTYKSGIRGVGGVDVGVSLNEYSGSRYEESSFNPAYYEIFIFLAIHIAWAPFYYIYFWVVAKSYMKSLNEERRTTVSQIQPAHQPEQLAHQPEQLARQPEQLAYQPGQPVQQPGQLACQPGLPLTVMKGNNEHWSTTANPPGYLN